MMKELTQLEVLNLLDIRVGTVIRAENFAQAKKPAIKLWIDFGEIGTLQSSAQITERYSPDLLVGRQIIAIINFPPLRIAGFKSECLVLGATNHQGDVILIQPDYNTPNGWNIA